MKFVKSNLAKKLIIVLIAVILFNAVVPVQVQAVDFTGVVIKGISLFVLRILVTIDVALGVFMKCIDLSLTGVGDIIKFYMDIAEKRSDEDNPGELEDFTEDVKINDIYINTVKIQASNN